MTYKTNKTLEQGNKTEMINAMNKATDKLYKILLDKQITNRTNKKQNKPRQERKINNLLNKFQKQGNKNKKMMKKKRISRLISKEIYSENKDIYQTNNIQMIWNKIHISDLTINNHNSNTEETIKIDTDKVLIEKFKTIERPLIERMNDVFRYSSTRGEIEISSIEVNNVIRFNNKKTRKGPEGLRFVTFNKHIDTTRQLIINITKLSIHTNTLPDACKLGIGKIIPKKTKGQFRIVHISTPLQAIIEQVILHRLEFKLESLNLLDPNQFGFTAKKDRRDLIARIIEICYINKSGTGNNATTIIALDIKGAFDNIKQDNICKKLVNDIGEQNYITKWIVNMLRTRKIKLEFMGKESKTRDVCAGVPQGSSLGPILWNFTIENIMRNLNVELQQHKTQLLTYADDIFIISNNQSTESLQEIL